MRTNVRKFVRKNYRKKFFQKKFVEKVLIFRKVGFTMRLSLARRIVDEKINLTKGAKKGGVWYVCLRKSGFKNLQADEG